MGTENTTAQPLELREGDDGSVEVNLEEAGAAQETGTATNESTTTEGGLADEERSIRRDNPDDDDEAGELARAATDEEREAIRERRRQERKDRRQRQRDRFDQMRVELAARDRIIDEMRVRLDTIDRRSTGADMASLDARIRREQENLSYLTNVIADGTKVGNGEAVAQATVQMTEVQQNLAQLKGYKSQLANASKQPKQAQLDPRMVVNASTWMNENPWYDPAKGDADSRQVLLLDQRLAEEGFDPNYPEYWTELSKRVAQVLPHRAAREARQDRDTGAQESGYNAPASRGKPSRSVVTGSSSTSAVSNSRPGTSFRLSPERVQALKDAGMWDDPVARDKAIRQYRSYDAEQASSAGRR